MTPVLECVPNFSEGRDPTVIRAITEAIGAVPGAKVLHVDPGHGAHRTVITFAGAPAAVTEAAFRAIRRAGELIDMTRHHGEHPRLGATDVCPLVPVSGLTLDDAAALARALGERVGRELNLPVYLYEHAQPVPARRNLADIRAGEYEGLAKKILRPEWRPDFGPAAFDARRGATVVGARDFLAAYNVNLATSSRDLAHEIACDVRTSGRVIRDSSGVERRVPGMLRAAKAIGWYIPEYGRAQVSMNLTQLAVTPVHTAFEAVRQAAAKRGVRVTGSELIGLLPLRSLLDAGRHFAEPAEAGASEDRLLEIAVRGLGLDDLGPFDPKTRVIEHLLGAT